jgi:hypothetical protein
MSRDPKQLEGRKQNLFSRILKTFRKNLQILKTFRKNLQILKTRTGKRFFKNFSQVFDEIFKTED